MSATNITPPRWLSDKARKHWSAISQQLQGMGLMTTGDTLALAMLCDALADYLQATVDMDKIITENGSIYLRAKGGGAYQHPALGVRNNAFDRVLKVASKMGLTPVDRRRAGGKKTAAPRMPSKFNLAGGDMEIVS